LSPSKLWTRAVDHRRHSLLEAKGPAQCARGAREARTARSVTAGKADAGVGQEGIAIADIDPAHARRSRRSALGTRRCCRRRHAGAPPYTRASTGPSGGKARSARHFQLPPTCWTPSFRQSSDPWCVSHRGVRIPQDATSTSTGPLGVT
jgi:hypothetical protein